MKAIFVNSKKIFNMTHDARYSNLLHSKKNQSSLNFGFKPQFNADTKTPASNYLYLNDSFSRINMFAKQSLK